MIGNGLRLNGVSLLALGIAGAGFSAPAAVAQEDTALLQNEIVVTTQKREQTVQDVPINVTAYTQESLDRLGIEQFDELAVFVPGLQVQEQSPNNPGFVIRGITSDSGEATQEPRVALFLDGVSISKSRGSYVELHDIERIEAAKGPQATLFGRGALIGAVSVIQAKADPSELSARVAGAVGNYDYRKLEGMLNLPLIEDQLAVRFSAIGKRRDGVVENTVGGEALNGVGVDAYRASLGWTPNDAVRVDVIYNLQHDNAPGTAFKSGTFAPPFGSASPYTPGAFNTFAGFLDGTPLGLDREVNSLTGLVSWDLSPTMTLSSITGWRDFNSLEVFDPDGTALPLFVFAEDAQGEQLSQELRINHTFNDQISWFAGVSWFDEDGFQRVPLQFDERVVLARITNFISVPQPQSLATLTSIPVQTALLQGLGLPESFAGALAPQLKANHRETFTNYGETTALDLFADATFAVTEQLEVSAGLRWSRDEKTSRQLSTLDNGGSVLGAILSGDQAAFGALLTPGAPRAPIGLFTQPTLRATPDARSEEFDGVTWRLVANYEPVEWLNMYASVARGRRPEVISASTPSAPGGPTRFSVIDAEEVTSYELGAKALLLDGTLALDTSVYRYGYENFQTTDFVGAQIVTINAGEANAIGLESQFDWRLSDVISLQGTYAYNQARLRTGARDGNRFRLSPDHALSLALDVTAPAPQGTVFLRPSFTWQSSVFFDDDNDRASLQVRSPAQFSDFAVDEKQDSYGLLNFRFGYEHQSGVSILGFVANVADKKYLIDAGNTGDIFGIPTFIRGTPRTYGLEIRKTF
jgi:outer membrane receptor protein involved in Fe transport